VGGPGACRCTVTLDLLDYVARRRSDGLAAFSADIVRASAHRPM